MKEIKEVIVCSNGDSRDLKTWSNVPYFFCCELENRRIKVDRVNFKVPNNTLSAKCVRLYAKVKKIIIEKKYGVSTNYKYNKTHYYDNEVKKRIKEGVDKYPGADLIVVFDLSRSIDTNIPYISFSDWTIEYRIKNRYQREPVEIEKKLITEQYSNMDESDAIVTIFPKAYELIKEKYPDKTYYFGHFVNTLEKYKEDIDTKFESNHLLFIGREKYIPGLKRMIKVVEMYNKSHDDKLEIDVIGITEDLIDFKDTNVHYYGYLNKSKENEAKKYYELIRNAKLMVNLTDRWNGASSLIEALYHGTPLLVSWNLELSDLIKEDKKYCRFIKEDDADEKIVEELNNYLSLDKKDYADISRDGHNWADEMTWDKYVDKFVKTMEEKL